MGPSKQLRDKVLDIVGKNKDIDFDDIITHMKKEVGIRGDSLIKLVDEILRWWEESGKILRMVDRRTKTGMYRMNENAKLSRDIVSEAISELGLQVTAELHENRQLERFVNAFYKIHPKIKLNGVSKDELEKLADKAMKQGDGGDKSSLLLRTFLKKSGATGMIGEEALEISESAKYKKVKDLNPDQSLWVVGKEFFVISYSPYAHETAVFRSDRNGRVKDMSGVWAYKGHEEPEGVAKMLAKHAKDFEIKEQR